MIILKSQSQSPPSKKLVHFNLTYLFCRCRAYHFNDVTFFSDEFIVTKKSDAVLKDPQGGKMSPSG